MKLFFETIFIIFISVSLNAQIQNRNISGTEYDINDPRNPNCPCHKLQKQAEEEYKQKQTNNNNLPKNLFAQQYFEASNFESQTDQSLSKLKTKEVIELNSHKQKDIPNTKKINNNHIKNSYNSATVKLKITTKKLRLKMGKKMKPKRKPLSGSNFKSAKKRVVCFVW